MSQNGEKLSEVVLQIAEQVRQLREDQATAETEFDDFSDETNAALQTFHTAMRSLASKIEDLERSHAALTVRVDRLQGLG